MKKGGCGEGTQGRRAQEIHEFLPVRPLISTRLTRRGLAQLEPVPFFSFPRSPAKTYQEKTVTASLFVAMRTHAGGIGFLVAFIVCPVFVQSVQGSSHNTHNS